MNIVYLFPEVLYSRKMSGGRRWYGEAVAAHPDVNLKLWGEGWPGYKANRPLGWNLSRGDLPPDRLWIYKHEGLLRLQDNTTPTVVTYNECWPTQPRRALNEVLECGASLVIHHHENDAKCFDGFHGKLVHIPHGAPEHIFYSDRPHSERPIVCLSSGVHSPEIYPLRAKLAALIYAGELPGKIRKHPGYRLPHKAACDAQSLDYAADLQNSQIAFACCSTYRYALSKLFEALIAGCLVISDMPDDEVFRSQLGQYIVEVDPNSSKAELKDVADWWIAHPMEREARARSGQRAAREHFTTTRYAERFVEAVENML